VIRPRIARIRYSVNMLAKVAVENIVLLRADLGWPDAGNRPLIREFDFFSEGARTYPSVRSIGCPSAREPQSLIVAALSTDRPRRLLIVL
jgi:hypothetical protein